MASTGDTADRILDAAVGVFATHGYAGASTRALAAAASVNIATIAYHFGDKQGLYDAVIDHVYARLLGAGLPIRIDGSPAQRVRQLTAAVYAVAREEHAAIRLLLRHVMEHQRLPDQTRTRWGGVVLDRAREGLAAVGLNPASIDPLALLSINHLIARYAVSDPGDLAAFAGAEDPHEAVATHLGEIAVAILGVE